jgi:uncharacterized protein (TIGR02611 family)
VYRLVVGSVGLAITVFLLPLPGPGWLVVFVGLTILASEFASAQRLRDDGLDRRGRWTAWRARRRPRGRALAALGATLAAIAAGPHRRTERAVAGSW